jgi:hypothetical protein
MCDLKQIRQYLCWEGSGLGDACELHQMQAVLAWDSGGGMPDLNQVRQFLGRGMLT